MEGLNSSEAAKELFELYGEAVYRYVRFTLGDPTEAEDAVQEIFLQVLKSWPRFEYRSSPKTWLWKITSNYIKTVIRKRRHSPVSLPDTLELVAAPTDDPAFLMDLERDLKSLPIPQRQVFVLRILQDMSSKETAQALGWTEVKVRVTLHRAVRNLQNKLQVRMCSQV